LDAATISAIFTSGWGNNNSEKIVMAEPFTGEGSGGEVEIFGASGNYNLLMTNKLLSKELFTLPRAFPIILPCVPCAPLISSGGIFRPSPGSGQILS
jgi:hypothetical protein